MITTVMVRQCRRPKGTENPRLSQTSLNRSRPSRPNPRRFNRPSRARRSLPSRQNPRRFNRQSRARHSRSLLSHQSHTRRSRPSRQSRARLSRQSPRRFSRASHTRLILTLPVMAILRSHPIHLLLPVMSILRSLEIPAGKLHPQMKHWHNNAIVWTT